MKRRGLKLLLFVLTLCLLSGCVKTNEPKDELLNNDQDQQIVDDNTIIDEEIIVDENEIFNEDDYVEEEKKEDKKEETKKEETSKPAKLNKYYIKVNRLTNVVTVYTYDDEGKYTVPVKAMVCSTGKNNRTPVGTFKMSSKHRWQLMNGDVYSQYASRITGHILFHSVPYSKASNSTLKINYYNQLGKQASAGCVRLTCEDAKWIYSNCPSGTVVNIFDGTSYSDPLGKPSAMKLSTDHPCAGWDPTDPDSKNPWKKTPPIIKVVNDSFIELGSSPDLLKRISAEDVYGKTLKPTLSGQYDFNKEGTYQITYKAVDSRGNSATLSTSITVKDTTAPTIKYSGVSNYDGDLNALEDYIHNHLSYKDSNGIKDTTVNINVDEDNNKVYVVVEALDHSNNKNTLELTINIVKKEVPDDNNQGDQTDQDDQTNQDNQTNQEIIEE